MPRQDLAAFNLAWKLKVHGRSTANVDGTWYNQRDLIVKALSLSDSDRYSSTQASLDYCLLAELLGNVTATVEINGMVVNQQLCWIRALEHDSTRWRAWLRLGEDLARSGVFSRAFIRGETCSAVCCFARAGALDNKRREALLQLGLRMRDDDYVVVRGKRMSRAACCAIASERIKVVLR
jgi:hypothetical protein